jgi:hypothetical protein
MMSTVFWDMTVQSVKLLTDYMASCPRKQYSGPCLKLSILKWYPTRRVKIVGFYIML